MTTIAVGAGLAGQIVAQTEGTYGVAPSLASARSYEFKSETLELKKTTITGEGLAAGKVYQRARRRVLTNYDMGGAIVMELPTRQMAFWAQFMVGSFGQGLATPTQIASSGIYASYHQPGSLTGHSFAVQKGVPAADNAAVEPFTEVGCKISDWELKVATGAIAELTLTLTGRNELGGTGNGDPLNGAVPTLATFGTPSSGRGEELFHFRQATLYSGGTPNLAGGKVTLAGATAVANVKDASVKHSFKFDDARYFLGSNGFKAEPIENGYRSITGALTAEWFSNEALYNSFSADTTTSLQLTFVGPTVSTSNYLFDVIIPNIKLDGETPKIPGPPVVTQAVTFTGLDDEATAPIQILYQSEDSAI
jgi:Phage tail tube protein